MNNKNKILKIWIFIQYVSIFSLISLLVIDTISKNNIIEQSYFLGKFSNIIPIFFIILGICVIFGYYKNRNLFYNTTLAFFLSALVLNLVEIVIQKKVTYIICSIVLALIVYFVFRKKEFFIGK